MIDVFYQFLTDYGYWFVLGGALIEGESIVLLAGIFAHQGVLYLPWVMVISFIGTLISDQFLFYFGRKYGAEYIDKRPAIHAKIEKAYKLLEKYGVWFILANRFIYGVRIIGPIIIGSSGYPPKKFSLLNIFAAAIWAIGVAAAGFYLAEPALALLEAFQRYQKIFIISIIVIAVIITVFFRWRKKKRAQAS